MRVGGGGGRGKETTIPKYLRMYVFRMYLEQGIYEFISDWWVHCGYAHGPSTL